MGIRHKKVLILNGASEGVVKFCPLIPRLVALGRKEEDEEQTAAFGIQQRQIQGKMFFFVRLPAVSLTTGASELFYRGMQTVLLATIV